MMACFLSLFSLFSLSFFFLAARGLPPAGEGRLEHVLHHQGPHTHGQYVPVLPRCLLPHLRPGPAHSVERRVAGRKKTRLSNHFRDDISNPDHFTKTGSGQTQRESTQTKPKAAGVSLSVSFFLSSFLPFFLQESRIASLGEELLQLFYAYVSRSLFKADRLSFSLHLCHGAKRNENTLWLFVRHFKSFFRRNDSLARQARVKRYGERP